ncbi:LEA type 2 family protein [Paenimyroides ceti]
MKNGWILSLLFLFLLSACGFGEQKKELENLAECKFSVASIDEFKIAGVAVDEMIATKNYDISKMPKFIAGFLSKRLPLNALINVKIENPTSSKASVNEFDYIILFEGTEIANGVVDQPIKIEGGGSTVVPVNLKGNVYELLANNEQVFLQFLKGDKNAKATVTFKVKPTVMVAGKSVKSPGYFSFEKQITPETLLRLQQK